MIVSIKNTDDFTIVIKDNLHQKVLEIARAEKSNSYGKYLLFSSNREALMEISEQIVSKLSLSEYWVSKKGGKGHFAYVCKIYDVDNKFATYIDHMISISKFRAIIKFRYFKPEWKTENGVYSNAYLKGKENNDIL